MKHILKYILIFLYTAILAGVIANRFTEDFTVIAIAGGVAGILSLIASRKKIITQPFSRLLLIGSFLLFISVPLAGKKETDSFEKRKLAEFPEFRLSNVWKFFYGYQTYFNDRFAFRNDAVQAISKLRFRLFHISPMPKIVKVGSDDWLFTSREEYILDTSTPYTPEQLDTVITNLHIITKYFDIRGIKYYFSMIPIKERIYPEYMPADLLRRMQFSKAEQLNERLRKEQGIRFIDCKPALIEGKKTRPTYYKVDTHWNEYGAFLGYEQIIHRIKEDFPSIVPFTIDDFDIDSSITDAGDLQLLMGFRDVLYFKHYHMTFKNPPELVIVDSTGYGDNDKRYSIRELKTPGTGLKLFLIRDSFSQYLRIFMTPHFDRTVLAWVPVVPVAQVMREKPDLVVQEILEHFVVFTLQLPPEIKGDTLFLNTYFPGYLNQPVQ